MAAVYLLVQTKPTITERVRIYIITVKNKSTIAQHIVQSLMNHRIGYHCSQILLHQVLFLLKNLATIN